MVTRYIKDAFLYGAGDSIVGQVRKVNEDNCGYRKTINGDLFVVCDGMGGHVGGATASHIAVDSILDYISQHAEADKRILLNNALQFANMQILGAAAQDSSLKGMGTTACVVLVEAQNIWIAHVGDSRIYLYSESEKYLYRITKDHSLVQGLVDKGELDDRDAEHHPQKNIILRALGTKPELEPEIEQSPVRAQVGDTILICSDGLCGMIDDNEIEAFMKKDFSLEDKVQNLIDAANAPGKGKDNITVQLIQVQSSLDNLSSHPNFNPNWRRKGSAPAHTPTMPVAAPITKENPDNPRKNNRTVIIGISLAGVLSCVLLCLLVLIVIKPKINDIGQVIGESQQKSGVETTQSNVANIPTEATAEAEVQKAEEETKKAEAEAEKAEAEAEKAKAEAVKAEAEAVKAKAEAQRAAEETKKAKEDKKKAEAEAEKAKAEAAKAEAEAAKAKAEAETHEKAEAETHEKAESDAKASTKAEGVEAAEGVETKKTADETSIEKSVTLKIGKELNFVDLLDIEEKKSKAIKWTSSDDKVVKITTYKGKGIKAQKVGSATITGKKDGKELYRIKVLVTN